MIVTIYIDSYTKKEQALQRLDEVISSFLDGLQALRADKRPGDDRDILDFRRGLQELQMDRLTLVEEIRAEKRGLN